MCGAALACDARVLCTCACCGRACVCVCCARAAGVRCVLYSVVRPVCAAGRRRLGWQGCAAGCGVLWVVARLPDGVLRPLSPPDRVVGDPGRGHADCAACEAVCARPARMFPCGEGRAYVFTLRARAGAGGGVVSPRSDVGWSSAWRGRARKEALPRHRVAAKEKEFLTKRAPTRISHSIRPVSPWQHMSSWPHAWLRSTPSLFSSFFSAVVDVFIGVSESTVGFILASGTFWLSGLAIWQYDRGPLSH